MKKKIPSRIIGKDYIIVSFESNLKNIPKQYKEYYNKFIIDKVGPMKKIKVNLDLFKHFNGVYNWFICESIYPKDDIHILDGITEYLKEIRKEIRSLERQGIISPKDSDGEWWIDESSEWDWYYDMLISHHNYFVNTIQQTIIDEFILIKQQVEKITGRKQKFYLHFQGEKCKNRKDLNKWKQWIGANDVYWI